MAEKLAYGRQGLAGVSLHASGAQLGQKRSDHFSWQTDKHTLHHNVCKSSSSSTSSSPLARVHFKRPPPAAEAPLSSLWSVKNFEEGEECWIFLKGQQFRHSNTYTGGSFKMSTVNNVFPTQRACAMTKPRIHANQSVKVTIVYWRQTSGYTYFLFFQVKLRGKVKRKSI